MGPWPCQPGPLCGMPTYPPFFFTVPPKRFLAEFASISVEYVFDDPSGFVWVQVTRAVRPEPQLQPPTIYASISDFA